jgi:ParB-like chromosome segregation protein Spo0J
MSTNIQASSADGLKIIRRPLAELKPDPANSRQHSKKQIKQIAKSIKAFGFNVPVLVDAELNVIAGHGRVLACREAGIDEVPTVCLEHLTPTQARAFRIADNKLAENATWDDRLLAEQLRDLSLSGLDFDVEVTGFEMGEIDLLIGSLGDPPAEDEADPADVVPEIVAVPPVSTLGDVRRLPPPRAAPRSTGIGEATGTLAKSPQCRSNET